MHGATVKSLLKKNRIPVIHTVPGRGTVTSMRSLLEPEYAVTEIDLRLILDAFDLKESIVHAEQSLNRDFPERQNAFLITIPSQSSLDANILANYAELLRIVRRHRKEGRETRFLFIQYDCYNDGTSELVHLDASRMD